MLKTWFTSRPLLFKVIFIIAILGVSYFAVTRIFVKSAQPQYQTSQVEKGDLVVSVTASGAVTTSNVQEVTTQASGVVSMMYVTDGQKVTKGQKIAQIDLDLVGKQRYTTAYASYLNAQKSVDTANNAYRASQASLAVVYDEVKGHDADETLVMKDTRTRAEVANDNAYAGTITAQAQLNAASLTFSQSSPNITAPSNGTIRLSVTEGSQISAGSSTDASNQRIGTVTTDGTPIVSLNLSEIDVLKVQTLQKASVTFDSISDKTFTGKVVAIDKLGTSTSGVTTYTTLIKLDINSENILPHMAGSANIITNVKNDVLLVPLSAIVTQNSQKFVRTLKNGALTEIPVEVGLVSSTQAEIVSGLSEGDTIVTSIIQATTTGTNTSTSPFSAIGGNRGFSTGGGAVRGVTTVR